MAVDEIENLIEQHQDRHVGGSKYPADRFGAGRGRHRCGAEFLDALIAGDLAGEIDPRRLAPGLRVPGITDKHADARGRRRRQPGRPEQFRYPGPITGVRAGLGEMVERGERVGLAAAELRDQRQHRRSVSRLPRQAPQHHPGVLFERPGEAGPRKELLRPGVVIGRGAADHLLERNGELIGAE